MGDIKTALENTLLNADWMDEKTRDAALSKLNNMKRKIGFPDYITNQALVLKPYAGVRITANTFFENSLTLRKVYVRWGVKESITQCDKFLFELYALFSIGKYKAKSLKTIIEIMVISNE